MGEEESENHGLVNVGAGEFGVSHTILCLAAGLED